MAHYKIIDPSLRKLDDLARLSFNLRFWTIEFRGKEGKAGKLGLENHQKMLDAERELDNWFRQHIIGLPKTEIQNPVDDIEN